MDPRERLETLFPNLRHTSYQIIRPASNRYNCIAHAAGKDDAWWQPGSETHKRLYWPAGAPSEWSLEALVATFSNLGYVPCEQPDLEPGFEKIVLYTDASGEPTHAARQLPSGSWSSKLGELEEIQHETLEGLEGQAYGKAVKFLKRPR